MRPRSWPLLQFLKGILSWTFLYLHTQVELRKEHNMTSVMECPSNARSSNPLCCLDLRGGNSLVPFLSTWVQNGLNNRCQTLEGKNATFIVDNAKVESSLGSAVTIRHSSFHSWIETSGGCTQRKVGVWVAVPLPQNSCVKLTTVKERGQRRMSTGTHH